MRAGEGIRETVSSNLKLMGVSRSFWSTFCVLEQGIRIKANLFVSITQFVNYGDFVNSGRDFVSVERLARKIFEFFVASFWQSTIFRGVSCGLCRAD